MDKWQTYGDPLLERLDEKIDEAVTAIQHATEGLTSAVGYSIDSSSARSHSTSDDTTLDVVSLDDGSKTLYAAYWAQLKAKFFSSQWFRRVDDILLQNKVVRAFTAKMIRPAEVFYNTVTEEFIFSHSSQDDFLAALKERVGPAWDDRLAPLATGFYTTAQAVSALVGAGKFLGGALQLGRARINSALDELMAQWDRVLGLTELIMDRYLPEQDEQKLLAQTPNDQESDGGSDYDSFSDESIIDDAEELPPLSPYQDATALRLSIVSAVADEKEGKSDFVSAADSEVASVRFSKKRSYCDLSNADDCDDDVTDLTLSESRVVRSSGAIVSKFSKRIRQRVPTIESLTSLPTDVILWSADVKRQLSESAWFAAVDDILMQNAFVRALASFVRPAEHFFNTAINMFQQQNIPTQITVQRSMIEGMATVDEVKTANDGDLDMTEYQPLSERSDSFTSIASTASALSTPNTPHLRSNSQTLTHRRGHNAVSSSALSVSTYATTVPSTGHSLALSPSPLSALDLNSPDVAGVVDDFVFGLREALGASWDDRLVQPAKSFLQIAVANHQQTHPLHV